MKRLLAIALVIFTLAAFAIPASAAAPEYKAPLASNELESLTALPTSERISESVSSTASTLIGANATSETGRADVGDISKGVSLIGYSALAVNIGRVSDGVWSSAQNSDKTKGVASWSVATQNITYYNANGVAGTTDDCVYKCLLTYNFGTKKSFDAIGYFTNATNGYLGAADIYVSDDGVNWTLAGYYNNMSRTEKYPVVTSGIPNDEMGESISGSTPFWSLKGASGQYLRVAICCENQAQPGTCSFREMVVYGGAYVPNTSADPEFESVNITLDENITMNYYVKLPDSVTNPKLFAAIGGHSFEVEGVKQLANYKFSLEGIAPQYMGDKFTAEVKSGDTTVVSKEYSVLDYLTALKAKTKEDLGYSQEKYDACIALVNDLLVYGGAAQKYTGYNTSALVDNGITGSGREVPDSVNKKEITDNGNLVEFKTANVFFDSINKVQFTFTAESVSGLTFKLNGSDIAFTTGESGTYVITTEGIKASEFNSELVLTAYSGENAGASVKYSVNSYAFAMKGDTDVNMAALAAATYNYGVSADAFAVAA